MGGFDPTHISRLDATAGERMQHSARLSTLLVDPVLGGWVQARKAGQSDATKIGNTQARSQDDMAGSVRNENAPE